MTPEEIEKVSRRLGQLRDDAGTAAKMLRHCLKDEEAEFMEGALQGYGNALYEITQLLGWDDGQVTQWSNQGE